MKSELLRTVLPQCIMRREQEFPRKHIKSVMPAVFMLCLLLFQARSQPVWGGMNVWTSFGPDGGTIPALVVNPGDPRILYAGSESGGIFKSINGGANWSSVNAGLPAASFAVGALAIDPQDPTTLYAGTLGGVFKSTNGGTTWNGASSGLASIGETADLQGSGGVNSLVVDAHNPRTIYAGIWGRGVFKSSNGATSWNAVEFRACQ